MDLNSVMDKIRAHPRIKDAGMVLIHSGLVRSYNLQGEKVSALELEPDRDKAEAVRQELLQREGIVEILVWFNQGRLEVGEPIMVAAVAGGTRPQVFPVLEELIDRLKKEAATKTEELG
jgi:molybdopterin synthase catalytic subunit